MKSYTLETVLTWSIILLTLIVFSSCAPRIEQHAQRQPIDLPALPADRYCLRVVEWLEPGETALLIDEPTGRISVVHRSCATWHGNLECRYLVWPIGTQQDPTLARGYAATADFLTDGARFFGLR